MPMVPIMPNAALIKASVLSISAYGKQPGFSLLKLKVSEAAEKKGMGFLFDKTADKTIQAIISDQKLAELQLKARDLVSGELKKVSPELWRVNESGFTISKG